MQDKYRILLQGMSEWVVIENVKKVDKSEVEVSLYNGDNEIVGFFNRNIVQGMFKEPTKTSKNESKTELSIEESILGVGCYNPFSTGVHKKTDTAVQYKIQKNKETNGFEVEDISQKETDKNNSKVEQATLFKDTEEQDKTQPVEPIKSSQINARMKYKDMSIIGVYDTGTNKIIIPKGQKIRIKQSGYLSKNKGQSKVLKLRKDVLQYHTEPYNSDYKVLKEDMTFNSLSQATVVLTGAVVSIGKYWDLT